MAITHLSCIFLKATIPCPYALTSYSLISVTMYAPYVYHEESMFLNVTSNPRLFLILLEPKFFQTALDYSRLMTSCHVTGKSHALSLSHCRLIIIILQYLNPNPNSLSTPLFYNTLLFIVNYADTNYSG